MYYQIIRLRMMLLALFCPSIHLFVHLFFLSSFRHWKFVTNFFSGIIQARIFKCVTVMGDQLMYCSYWLLLVSLFIHFSLSLFVKHGIMYFIFLPLLLLFFWIIQVRDLNPYGDIGSEWYANKNWTACSPCLFLSNIV